ncbi:DUF3800 domain-containing protein [Helicobacter kayseriensis]|uniref:DUF3800 domain-containing protein n=1 Tax=Helicobacter kayseriensis TaxID=2905877 RepID=UPI001E45A9D5|nr:DUF3800 domain-containing protein [Helicobacter kayseriensis]MCE3048507.1 DUF3800 domain-containing protein [Helicobacter kayseriensis]
MHYKIFCDESNHLKYKTKTNFTLSSHIMVLGAICVPSSSMAFVNRYIKFLKHKYNYQKELKWTKLTFSQKQFYSELIDFFFDSVDLRFQALVVPNKQELEHDKYNQGSQDIFYYKMFYYVLRNLLRTESRAEIYLDYKDTRCAPRMKELERVLCHEYKQIKCFTVRSHESCLIQLTDLLIGAIAYKARDDIDHMSKIKNYIVQKLEQKTNIQLEQGTPPWETKFNIFRIQLGKSR